MAFPPVRIEPVKGGTEVNVLVEKGHEAYRGDSGALYEERRIAVADLRKAISAAIDEGKKLAESEE